MRRPRFVVEEAHGQWWFTLRAPNGERICQSEMYPDERTARKGVAAVKRWALPARITRD